MPAFFTFTNTDPYVTERIPEIELAGVTVWQNARLEYQFSFHTQHEAGWPCYIKEPTGPRRNLPKINLLVPTDPLTILEGGNVRVAANGKDFKAVIAANLAIFQTLAEGYYEGEEVEEVKIPDVWIATFECTNVKKNPCVKRVRLPDRAQAIGDAFWANYKYIAVAPVCSVHKNNVCMKATKCEAVPAAESIEVTLGYDEYGDVVTIR